MSKRRNRKLTKILLVMTAILIVLVAITYIDEKTNANKDNSHSPNADGGMISTDNSGAPSPAGSDSSDKTDISDKNGDNSDKPNTSDEDIHDNDNLIPPDASDDIDDDASPAGPIVLAFAGDVNFDEDSKPVARYDRMNEGILGCISQELVDEMNHADIFMLNNEFAYSTRGKEIAEKSYTFRAHPKRVNILKEMGVDIVSLANNHALDFGVDALLDTFTTLDEAGIDYIGAGENMNRAKAPVYYTIEDTTIAYLAASRVIYAMDWYATDSRPGMIGTYDPALFLTCIEEARENSDFVIVYLHWGVERTHEPVQYQKNLAKMYIDAGADAVIGCHPHVMQGIEFYKGKPIAYSLGNYWFNATKRETGLLKLYLNPDKTVDVQLLPAMGEDTYTYLITKESERKAYFKFMKDISFDVEFDEDGFVTEKQ